jgi:simple sugar transport system permease protein
MSTEVTAPPEQSAERKPSPPRRLLQWMISGNTFTVTVLAFFSALVVGAIIIVLATPAAMTAWHYALVSPGTALSESWSAITSAYGALFSGALGSREAISETLVSTTPLLMAGLGVALAFRAGLFNIGGQGQLILGAIGATWAGFSFSGLPIVLHLPLALLAGAVLGGAWAFVPGVLKARTGAHEVITTMMLNYVALNLLGWLLIQKQFCATNPCTNAISKTVRQSARLPHIAGSNLRVNLGIVLAVLFTFGVAWLLQRSTLGFRFRMTGLNPDAAGVAGVSTKRMYVIVLTMSGMLVGLAGAFSVLGVDYQVSPGYGGTTGFDAITVAILGHGSPLGVALASLLFGAFVSGGRAMQASTGIPLQLVVVIQAVLVLFVAAPGVIRTIYRIKVRRGAERVFGGWG